ncbi:MAG TPA: alpha/beta hydrolase [Trebonia sp.]|jgi:pimeloyl-ACP methyl ester carboxylesterase|nr:alpha/beta hydrolase [Trebonia sp.]
MDVNAFLSHRRPVATPSGEIACTELGAGPAALFVHGVGTSGALWRQVAAELTDASRCIAVDLPAHGASPARDDMSPTALAEALADLCDGLGLGQVDLVGNDTGGAIAQIFAARHPGKIRTLTLTNCECEGNFPPADFAPIIEQARQGTLAPLMAALAADQKAWSTHPLSMGYEYPERVPEDAWRDYLTGAAGTIERARDCERLLASLDAADLDAAGAGLRALTAPTLLVWGTADTNFAVTWAYHLRDLIPGAREVIEVDGAKIFFPEERPGDLTPHLRRHWGR